MKTFLMKIITGIGATIFLVGVFTSMQRIFINFAFWHFEYSIIANEIPNFLVWLDCPETMRMNESMKIRAIVSGREAKASTQSVVLYGSGFDINPSEAVEVSIPEGEEVELWWTVTALEEGVQNLSIPVNDWDNSECYILVHNSPRGSYHLGRIFSLLCLFVSCVFVTPWDRLRSIRYSRQLGYSLIYLTFYIIFIALIAWKLVAYDQSVFVALLSLFLASPVVLIWHITTWRLECRIGMLKGIAIFLGYLFFTFLYIECLFLKIPWIDIRAPIETISIPTVYSNYVLLLLIPSMLMLFLYPRIISTWDLPRDEVSLVDKSIRVLISLFAYPIVISCFLIAMNESLLVFFY